MVKRENIAASIYIMECAGKYKIGLSRDVERRRKQLDNRPFKTTIIYKSPVMEEVYDLEAALHDIYKEKNIKGEWFDLSQTDIETIIGYFEEE